MCNPICLPYHDGIAYQRSDRNMRTVTASVRRESVPERIRQAARFTLVWTPPGLQLQG